MTQSETNAVQAFMLGGFTVGALRELSKFADNSLADGTRTERLEDEQGRLYGTRLFLPSGLIFDAKIEQVIP